VTSWLKWKVRKGELEMSPKIAVILAGFLVGAMCGCGKIPVTRYYQLQVPNETSSATVADPLPITVLVGPLKAAHLYREDRLVFGTETEEMGTYQEERWAAPPTEMIRELLWRTLRASHRYGAVNLLTSNSRGDYVLEGNLYDFKEVSGSMLVARMSMELELRDTKTGSIVWTHDYVHDEPVNEKDVAAVVAALDQNAQRCVNESEGNLFQYLSSHPKM